MRITLAQWADARLPERFWSKATPGEDCWLWTGCLGGHGYGTLWMNGATRYAHRLIYEALVGPIPEGLELDHLCRVRHCVNPAHLEPVTHKVNQLRGTSPMADSARKTHCLRGHPLSGPNLYLRPDGKGRQCRACTAIRGGWDHRGFVDGFDAARGGG